MPSERSRYLNRNRTPQSKYRMTDFIEQLPAIGADRLSEILAIRAENDPVLNKVLTVSLIFLEPISDFSGVVDCLDYALYVPEDTPRPENGYDLILDELLVQIMKLESVGKIQLAKQVAEYSLLKGNEMLDRFEEGVSWNCSLKNIEKWLATANENNQS